MTNIDNIKCCLFSNCCGKTEDRLKICCNYCSNKNCIIRCTDKLEECKYSVECGYHKNISNEEYERYLKQYKKSKKDNNSSDNTKDKAKEIKLETKDSKKQKSKKLTEDIINTMTKDQCKKELDLLKIRYLYKNTLPQLRQMLIDSIKEK